MDAMECSRCAKNRRFRWQFSLRTMLVVMVLASITLSWFATRLHKARRQQEAVREILKIEGCEVAYDGEDVYSPDLHFGKRPPLPPVSWSESLFGKDFVHRAGTVGLPAARVDEVIPQLQRLPYLRRVIVLKKGDCDDQQLEAAAEKIEHDVPSVETLMLEIDFDIRANIDFGA